MLKIIKILCVMAFFFMPLHAALAEGLPTGRYCGFVMHAGYEVKMEVTLELAPDGHLKGAMHYHDDGVITSGTLEQNGAQEGTKITFIWADKYGSGLAILNFDEKFDAFDGRWNAGLSDPIYPWTGKRCNDYTS